MPLYDYRCTRGHTVERFQPSTVYALACSVCGNPADRAPAHRVAIVGPTTDTRGMFRRFQEASADMDHAASRIEANTGQPVATPDWWSAAKQRAAAIERAGESPLRPLREST